MYPLFSIHGCFPLTCADLSDHVCTGGDGATKHHPAGGQAAHLHTIVEVSLVKTIAHLGPGLGQRRLVGGEGRGLELESARVLAAGADGLYGRVLVLHHIIA